MALQEYFLVIGFISMLLTPGWAHTPKKAGLRNINISLSEPINLKRKPLNSDNTLANVSNR